MRRNIALILTVVAALFATFTPVVLAITYAGQEATRAEYDRASRYAQDVLRRSEGTSVQILEAVDRLRALGDMAPCTPQSLSLMRQIDLSSSYLQAVGKIEGNRLSCSSLGLSGAAMDVGDVDLIHGTGVAMRFDVRLPFAPDSSFFVVESDGYAAIVHKDLPIDTALDSPDIAIATFSSASNQILTQRGTIDPSWIGRLGPRNSTQFIDDGHVIVVMRSPNYLIGSIAALPISHLNSRLTGIVAVLLPVGLVAGIVLALAVIYLSRQQRALPALIKSGLRRNEFNLVYQPVVDMRTGDWVGAEALLRWRRASGELIRPDLFIPAAEESGLIGRITERVLQLAASDAAGLFERHPGFHLGINLSPTDLHNDTTVLLMDNLIEATGAGRGNLLVEATERSFTDPEKAGPIIRRLRANGIHVAIDDFGTGYSSLAALQSLDLDYLKIDKAFVDTLGTGAATSSVVSHIIDMSKSLDLQMIAEGVETETQARLLRDFGVQYGQGWLFGKPMSLDQLTAHMEAQSNERQLRAG